MVGVQWRRVQTSLPFASQLVRTMLRQARFGVLRFLPASCAIAFSIFLGYPVSSVAQQATIEFNRDIRPILSEYCFACHGPDKNSRQADLRLDDREAAVASGAIVEGDAAASLIVERVLTEDPDQVMPPPKTGKKISPEQVELLKRWIQTGASYQPHWAFVPIRRDLQPPPASQRDSWGRNPIDAFAYQTMLEHGMQPAQETPALRWLRRVRLDLTGLPPTIDEVREVMADESEGTREAIVDRLLASDAYAERMANMWLDVARYADTFGYQSDVNMNVWPWRDWVIRAFQSNLPYDQFILWQLAGDLLPNATLDQKLATAFNRLHRQTNEGGSIEEEFRQVYIADRSVTAGTAFLGLTLECSRCHDHKYDPISQRDFYSFAAYFADIDEHGLYSHFTAATPTPALNLYAGDQQEKHEELLQKIRAAEDRLAQIIALGKKGELALPEGIAASDSETIQSPSETQPPSATWAFPLDGSELGLFGNATRFNGDDALSFPLNKPVPEDPNKTIQWQMGRETPFSISLWVHPAQHASRVVIAHQSVAAEDAAFRGMQLVLENGKPQFSLIHFWPGNAIRVEAIDPIPLNAWTQIGVRYDGSSTAAGITLFVDGKSIPIVVVRDQLTRDFRYRGSWGDSNGGSVQISLGARFRDIGFRDGCIDELQIFDWALSAGEMAALFNRSPERSEAQKKELMQRIAESWDPFQLRGVPQYDRAVEELQVLRRDENEWISSVRQIMTMAQAVQPRRTRVLERGAYDAPRDEVSPQPFVRLTQMDSTSQMDSTLQKESSPRDRLELARWVISDRNPLTSRVAVNRFWSIFFGRGIVASLEDFGSQGQVPTHPELLDWLASDFQSHGWDVKRLCKQIVLSSTYRQSSTPRDIAWETSDPDNRWLARGPRHRLSAEQVRDAALAATGLLVPKVGGPSVMPYQPAGLWEEAGTGKSYQQASGDGLYRRSMYTFWRRTAPPPSMLAFDATSRETCTARRETTTTPLQALVLLNDPQYIEAARVIAQSSIQSHPKAERERFQDLALRLLARPLTDRELAVVEQGYREQIAYFQANPEGAKAFLGVGEKPVDATLDGNDVAATTVVAETLMCFDDFVMKR